MTDRPSFHDLLARYVARHACEVHAETAGCPHLTPTWDDAADFPSSLYRDWPGLNVERVLTDPCPRHGGRP